MIHLRAMEPEDLDMLYNIENDEKIWEVGATNVPYSRYALHDYIANASNDIYADQQVRMIVENESGETIGIADITNFDPRHRRAEVGLVIVKQYRDKGYGRDTLTRLADYARNVINLHQLYAIIGVSNERTLHLFSQSGYREQARLKDWLMTGNNYGDAVLMQLIL